MVRQGKSPHPGDHRPLGTGRDRRFPTGARRSAADPNATLKRSHQMTALRKSGEVGAGGDRVVVVAVGGLDLAERHVAAVVVGVPVAARGCVGEPDVDVRAVGGREALHAEDPRAVGQLQYAGRAGRVVLLADERAFSKAPHSRPDAEEPAAGPDSGLLVELLRPRGLVTRATRSPATSPTWPTSASGPRVVTGFPQQAPHSSTSPQSWPRRSGTTYLPNHYARLA